MKLLLIVALSIVVLPSCSTVQPWERGTLARPEMAFVPDSLEQKIKGHIYFSKEAAEITGTGSGGGCGCN